MCLRCHGRVAPGNSSSTRTSSFLCVCLCSIIVATAVVHCRQEMFLLVFVAMLLKAVRSLSFFFCCSGASDDEYCTVLVKNPNTPDKKEYVTSVPSPACRAEHQLFKRYARRPRCSMPHCPPPAAHTHLTQSLSTATDVSNNGNHYTQRSMREASR